MKPDSANCAEMIISANSSASVGMSILAAEIVERHLAARQQRDDREQRDAGAVDLQPGDPAGRHAEIGQDQDEKNDRGVHRRGGGESCGSS